MPQNALRTWAHLVFSPYNISLVFYLTDISYSVRLLVTDIFLPYIMMMSDYMSVYEDSEFLFDGN